MPGLPKPPVEQPLGPRPTLQFRLKSWWIFQRALDPLAPPKPLRRPRQLS